MSYWNLRVIENKEDPKNTYCYIAEVYYDDDGNYNGYTHNRGVNLLADNLVELKEYYKMCAEAFEYPIIQEKEIATSK